MFPLRLISSGTKLKKLKKKKGKVIQSDNYSFIVFTNLQEFMALTIKKTDGSSNRQKCKFACISRSIEERKCTESKQTN